MIYAYRQGDALPDGCAGFYAVETAYNYVGDFHGDETVLYSSRERVDVSRKKFVDGQLVDMTEAESAIMDGIGAQAATDAEAERQAAKPDKLKAAENKFFDLCFAMLGDRQKRGFDEISAAIEAIATTDQETATALSLRLLAVDAECKREGGNQWWDTAAYHEEIVE